MHRKFIAAIISVSIAITAYSANSAAAGDRDTANFLAGLAGLAIIGAIIHDSNKKNKTTNYTSRDTYTPLPQQKHDYSHRAPARQYKHKYGAPSRHRGNVHHQPKQRPLPHRVSRKVLPRNCLRNIDTRRGQQRIFGNRCLNNNFRHVNKLPHACYTEVRSRGRWHHGYGARCLRNKGYSIARN